MVNGPSHFRREILHTQIRLKVITRWRLMATGRSAGAEFLDCGDPVSKGRAHVENNEAYGFQTPGMTRRGQRLLGGRRCQGWAWARRRSSVTSLSHQTSLARVRRTGTFGSRNAAPYRQNPSGRCPIFRNTWHLRRLPHGERDGQQSDKLLTTATNTI
jgi:hypothetical protein